MLSFPKYINIKTEKCFLKGLLHTLHSLVKRSGARIATYIYATQKDQSYNFCQGFFLKVAAEQNLSHDPSLSLSHHNSGGDGRRISDLR